MLVTILLSPSSVQRCHSKVSLFGGSVFPAIAKNPQDRSEIANLVFGFFQENTYSHTAWIVLHFSLEFNCRLLCWSSLHNRWNNDFKLTWRWAAKHTIWRPKSFVSFWNLYVLSWAKSTLLYVSSFLNLSFRALGEDENTNSCFAAAVSNISPYYCKPTM